MYQGSAARRRPNRGKQIARQPGLLAVLLIAGLVFAATAPALAGTVYAWGNGYYGQLGNGLIGYVNTPVATVGITNVRAVAGGIGHSVALKTDGTVWTWGSNANGELGNGSTTNTDVPVEVSGLSNAASVAAGGQYSLALKSDGTVRAWGFNLFGQLGDGTTTDSSVPVAVSGLTDVTAVAAGDSHSLALKTDGTVWAWGYNSYGQLGDGTNANAIVPVKVSGLSNVVAIAASGYHSLALKSDGTVWDWGDNAFGQLGNGMTNSSDVPVKVSGLTNVTAIAGGQYNGLALKIDGTVWAWGDNEYGQLGIGTTTNGSVPVEVAGLFNVTAIAGGSGHSLALKSDGTVWAWGFNGKGDLGDGTTNNSLLPVEVRDLSSVAAITSGFEHNLAVKTDGTVYAWGSNEVGELGNGIIASASTPLAISNFTGVMAVAGGVGYSLALKTDGTVWAWGNNYFGQLGDGTANSSSVPVEVHGLTNAIDVASGDVHGLALKTDGTVWAWGYNSYGQLGDGTNATGIVPVKVSGLSNVVAVAAGGYLSLALKSDGTVWAWGKNDSGQLGNGTTTNSSIPVKVSALSNVTAIAAGGDHALALRSDGTVWAWGNNGIGQLGNGTTTGSSVPIEVSGLSNIMAIAAGDGDSFALKSDGTLWAWGDNESGQLGVGTTHDLKFAPVEVSGLSNVTAIAGGESHSLAVKSDGTVWAWGENNFGELGIGIYANTPPYGSSAPLEVSGLSGAAAVATGDLHSLAVVGDVTAPITTASVSGPAGQNGWYTGPVTVTLSATDPDDPSNTLVSFYSVDGGAQQAYTAPFTLSGEAKHALTFSSEDRSGNHGATRSLTVNIDSTPPTTTLAFSGSAGADSASFTGPVTVTLTATDNLSGVGATYYALDGGARQTYAQPFTITADGKHTLTYFSADAAGNMEAVHTQTVLVDTSLPAITITAPANQTSYTLNQVVNASYSAADSVDGIVSLTGNVPSGSPIDTGSVGVKSFTVKAADTAGNNSQSSVSYTVSYGMKLLYDPAVAASSGAPVPISLQLVDASGANVSSANISLHAVSITAAGSPPSAGTGTGPAFTFEPTLGGTGGYVFNLSDKDLPAGSLNLNFIAGSDPTVHQAAFTSAGSVATIPAGISMVSVPFGNAGDLASLFGVQVFTDGAADVATYDPVSSQYLLYPHLPGLDGKSGLPGRGYWVLESRATTVQSTASANPSPLDVSLSPGWNMIGDPYAASLATGSLQVSLSTAVGGHPANQFISEPDAVTAGIIDATIWDYDSAGKQYVAATTLTPFEGYWIYVDPAGSGGQPLTLRFTQPEYMVVAAVG